MKETIFYVYKYVDIFLFYLVFSYIPTKQK